MGLWTSLPVSVKLSGINKSLAIWEQGDNYITEMQGLGNKLHEQIGSTNVANKAVNKTLDDIYLLNENMNVMEETFA